MTLSTWSRWWSAFATASKWSRFLRWTRLIKRLEVMRFGDSQKKKPRGKKILAGKSPTSEDSEVDDIRWMR